MNHIEGLERLSRLREAGALSEEEFQREKERLFADAPAPDQKRKTTLLVTGAIVLAALAGIAVHAWMREDNVAVSTAVPAKQVQPTALDYATSSKVIGLNPAYVEQRLGIPREKSDGALVFEVDGCTVTYWHADNAIELMTVDVNDTCRPTIDGKQVGPDTTFGEMQGAEKWGQYFASCLTGCGNAADPVIDLVYPGSRSNGFITVRYSTDWDQAADALDLWEKAVRQREGLGEFDSPDDYEPFNCVTNPPGGIGGLLSKMQVRAVSISKDDATAC